MTANFLSSLSSFFKWSTICLACSTTVLNCVGQNLQPIVAFNALTAFLRLAFISFLKMLMLTPRQTRWFQTILCLRNGFWVHEDRCHCKDNLDTSRAKRSTSLCPDQFENEYQRDECISIDEQWTIRGIFCTMLRLLRLERLQAFPERVSTRFCVTFRNVRPSWSGLSWFLFLSHYLLQRVCS